jgi:hypothetical protein
MCKPVSHMFLNKNNYVSIYNIEYSLHLEFSLLNVKLDINASSLLKQLNQKTGHEFKLSSEPINF